MFDDDEDTPWDTLLRCVEIINEHTMIIKVIGDELNKQERILNELLKQNQMLVKNSKIMNQNIKLINQRLSNLEKQNDTE